MVLQTKQKSSLENQFARGVFGLINTQMTRPKRSDRKDRYQGSVVHKEGPFRVIFKEGEVLILRLMVACSLISASNDILFL